MAAAAPARTSPAPKRRVRTSPRYSRINTKSAVGGVAAPQRRKVPSRRPGGQLIPIAVGAAGAVRQLPDSSLMVRMTRGRAWIAVLGVLLVGIVAINVVTLSLSAAAGHIDSNIQALEDENSLMRGRDAKLSGTARVRHDAAEIGLAAATTDQVGYVQASAKDVAVSAQRLAAAAGSGY